MLKRLMVLVVLVVAVLVAQLATPVLVSADDGGAASPVESVASPVAQNGGERSDWDYVRELLVILIGGAVSIGGLFVLYRSSPADFNEKALQAVKELIVEIEAYQERAKLTPTRIDDLAGYLAMFGAETLKEALKRAEDAAGTDAGALGGGDSALFG